MFRQKYLDYSELTQQLASWSKKLPGHRPRDLDRQERRGHGISRCSRSAATPTKARPAVWIDGNMHASEVCGSSVALAMAEDILALHRGRHRSRRQAVPGAHGGGDQGHAFLRRPADLARRCGGGAQGRPLCPLESGQRPLPTRATRTGSAPTSTATASPGYMRRQDPDGELVEMRDENGQSLVPPVMGARMPEDSGPFFRLYPEGRIANFDGRTHPAAVLPLRQPLRLQPELPVRVGAGAAAGGRRALSGQRARDARDHRLRDLRTRTSSPGSTCTPSAAC